ncbi:uncharacterized protein N7483_002868 [Penicillium malachiteum]|uniref:uncharacterized protein n=1 Tax=Penicillium malachiteum TaxID=1324776 RepID=UPI0025467BDD|nr:uncharacterized protein N7483_002868 [Penicillium malachiteum]KAJ5737743.1 hypothetical protein N7483_002868 [Penicillium malachiteum]
MANIQDLPVELLTRILEFVGESVEPNDYDLELGPETFGALEVWDLIEACLVSRKFRAIAQPLVFRIFEDDNLDDLNKSISFANTLCLRPDLGKYVQSISMLPLAPIEPGASLKPDEEDLLPIRKAVKKLQLGPNEEVWQKTLALGDPSVFAAIITSMTPNLRSLTLAGGIIYDTPFSHLFLRDPSFLSKLTTVKIEGNEEFGGYNISYYEEFLTRPKVSKVLFQYADLWEDKFPQSWTRGSLNVEDLEFGHCRSDKASIQKLMKACKKLKYFTFSSLTFDPRKARDPNPIPDSQFNAPQVLEATLLHKESLEHFQVEFERFPWDLENPVEYVSSCIKFGSFRPFKVLQSIAVPHAYLPEHPQFPTSVKELNITDCNTSVRTMVANIVTDIKGGLYPNLKSLKFHALDITATVKLPDQSRPPGKSPADCFLELQDMFIGTNIHFMICPYRGKRLPGFEEPTLDHFEDEDEYGYLGDGPIPNLNQMPNLFNMVMERALQDPDFAHIRAIAEQDPELMHLRAAVAEEQASRQGSNRGPRPPHRTSHRASRRNTAPSDDEWETDED